MWNEKAKMGPIKNIVDSTAAYVHSVDEYIETDERYDATSTDDGNSPLQSIDWGNTITLMRGGGSDATINHYARNYDFFDNEKWSILSGEYAMDSDSINIYDGNPYDYDGASPGIGGGERISLSIRAYHTAPADIPKTKIKKGDILCNDMSVARRGLADKFFSEYIYFLLNRKKLAIKTFCEIQHIIDMQWKDKYAIAGHTGWIDHVSVKISVQKGIEDVEFTMFEL